MSAETSIEWTHPPGFRGATWNPVVGCRRVSPGCERCYAETMAGRIARMGGPAAERYRLVVKTDAEGQPRGRWNGRFVEVPDALAIPIRRRAPTCWFVNSMSDLFGEGVSDEYIAAVFGVMAATPHHRYQILTKRAERLPRWFEWVNGHRSERVPHVQVAAPYVVSSLAAARGADGRGRVAPPYPWPLPNVWLGVSVENQAAADERIPHLLATPAAVRFLSVEPLLGPVDLRPWIGPHCSCYPDQPCDAYLTEGRCRLTPSRIGWVIIGGESGPGARPMDLAWMRAVVEQCRAAGVACFVKQLGADPYDSTDNPRGQPSVRLRSKKGSDPKEWPEDLRVRQWPEVSRG